MKLLQFIYTSCRKGQSSGAGFQTYALSEGITIEEQAELERITVYVTPMNAPPEPTPEEIKTFPTSFKFFKLKSGRFGVSQTCYTGRDYTGRFGNYFAHALVLDEGKFPFYPVKLWNSSSFIRQLEEAEEKREDSPPHLQALELNTIQQNDLSFSQISEYLENQPGIKRYTLQAMAAILNHSKNSRRIVFDLPSEKIIYLFAAIQLCFSVDLSHEVQFNTFSHDPEADSSLMVGTIAGATRFGFTNVQSEFEYYVFSNRIESKLECGYPFLELFEIGIEMGVQNLAPFNELLNEFNCFSFGEIFHEIYDLHILLIGNIEKFSTDRLQNVISCVLQSGRPTIHKKVLNGLSHDDRIISQLIDYLDHDGVVIFSKFLFDLLNMARIQSKIPYIFFNFSMDKLIFSQDLPSEEADILWKSILTQCQLNMRDFVEEALSDLRIGQFIESIAKPKQAAVVLNFVVTVSITAGRSVKASLAQSATSQLFDQCIDYLQNSPEEFVNLLKFTELSNEYSVELFMKMAKHSRNSSMIDLLAKHLYPPINELKADLGIRKDLDALKTYGLLLVEYKINLLTATDKLAYFDSYYRHILAKLKNYRIANFSNLIDELIRHTLPANQFSTSLYLLRYQEAIQDEKMLGLLIEIIESNIHLDGLPMELGFPISDLLNLKRSRHIDKVPDIVLLCFLGSEVEKQSHSLRETLNILKVVTPHLENIDSIKYQNFIGWLLPKLLFRVRDCTAYEEVASMLRVASHEVEFSIAWSRGVKMVFEKSEFDIRKLSQYILWVITIEWSRNSKTILKFREDIVIILVGLGFQKMNRVDKHMQISLDREGKSKSVWDSLFKEALGKEAKSMRGLLRQGLKYVKDRFQPKKSKWKGDLS